MTYASLQSGSAPVVRRRLSLLVVLGVLAAAALAAAPRPAAATYQLEGARWPNQPGAGVCCAVLQYEMNIIIWANNADVTGWQNGAAAWNNSAALVWVNPAPGNSPINLIDTTDSVDGWYGLTSLSSSGGTFTGATAWLNAFYTQGMSAAQIQTVATHELGHVIGLAHDTDACAVMNPDPGTMTTFCGGWVNTPQQDDVDGVNALY